MVSTLTTPRSTVVTVSLAEIAVSVLNSRKRVSMNPLKGRLMYREAQEVLADARALVASPRNSPFSSSSYLLGLLAFELLLKIVFEASVGTKAPKHHRYAEIFRLLPVSARSRILKAARTRIGPSALGRRHYIVLKELGDNFSGLRYPFEKYAHMTEAEYAKHSADWIARGGKAKEADFRHHPEEVFALMEAIMPMVEALASHSFDWNAYKATW